MTQNEGSLFEQECKYCGFPIPVAKKEVQEKVSCPRCGRPNLIGEAQPEVENAVEKAHKEAF